MNTTAGVPWEEIEHTADVAIRARGATLSELFANAARGMMSLVLGGTQPPNDQQTRAFSLQAPDIETLLVDWLTELAYLIEDKGYLVSTIENITLEENSLQAKVGGGYTETLHKHIKAVTYHNLSIEKTGDGFQATVVFDV